MALIYSCLLFLQLRGTPADLPYRPGLLLVLVLLDALLTMLLYHLLGTARGAELALAQAALHLCLYAGVLWLRSRSARFVQTATALFGMSLLFNALLLPILLLAIVGLDLQSGALDSVTASVAARFMQVVISSLLVWRLLAEGQVLRHALELPFAAATVIALSVFFVEIWLLQQWFPSP